MSRGPSGAVVIALPERPSQPALERLAELVRRPGKNTVVVRFPRAALYDPLGSDGGLDPDFDEVAFTGSALTARDGMWVALALSGLGAEPRPPAQPPPGAELPPVTELPPARLAWPEAGPEPDLSFESFLR